MLKSVTLTRGYSASIIPQNMVMVIMRNPIIAVSVIFFVLVGSVVRAEIADQAQLNQFVNKMVKTHHFKPKPLAQLFSQVEIKKNIIDAITRPAEGMPWYKYRKIFIRDARIQGGVKFWQENQQVLANTQQRYGVPAEIIVAIIGVETLYGRRTGGHRVIDALSTLAFAYPKRSRFFSSELEQFLLLCREEKISPLEPMGSYAGAMGMPQFMPSSYRYYAVDYESDNKRDIWHNPADTIASVANYFSRHHWQVGQLISFPVKANGTQYKKALTKGLKPDVTVQQLRALKVQLPEQLKESEKVKLLSFVQESGNDLWVGLDNFYVITRYNHSPLYAMAVFQLSEAIKLQYKKAKHG